AGDELAREGRGASNDAVALAVRRSCSEHGIGYGCKFRDEFLPAWGTDLGKRCESGEGLAGRAELVEIGERGGKRTAARGGLTKGLQHHRMDGAFVLSHGSTLGG